MFSISCQGQGYFKIPFVNSKNNVPIVMMKVNDGSGIFIIDTGATYSIINSNSANKYGFKIKGFYRHIGGIGAEKVYLRNTENLKIWIRGIPINVRFRAMNLDKLQARADIVGILGSDWILKNKVIIDYERKILWIKIKTYKKARSWQKR